MSTNTISDTLRDRLIKLASKSAYLDDTEDFCPYDIGGGNHDDTFFAGQSDGEILLAREILEALGIPYSVQP